MKRFTMSTSTQGLIYAVAAACTFAVLFSGFPTFAADMDANAKALVKLDDDWSKAAAAKDVDKVASFYADDAIAYPRTNPPQMAARQQRKSGLPISLSPPLRSPGRPPTQKSRKAGTSVLRPAPMKIHSKVLTARWSARKASTFACGRNRKTEAGRLPTISGMPTPNSTSEQDLGAIGLNLANCLVLPSNA
jgi:hypothetical protein